MYNRCKLTRLVVDSEWDEKVWKDAWKPRVTEVDEECVGVVAKAKRRNEGRGGKKRQKLDGRHYQIQVPRLPRVPVACGTARPSWSHVFVDSYGPSMTYPISAFPSRSTAPPS